MKGPRCPPRLARSARAPAAGPAAQVERLAVGGEEEPAEFGVAGDLPGLRGGDDAAEAQVGGALAGGRVGEVLGVHLDGDLRLDSAQQRQGATAQVDIGELHEGVGLLLRP
jgi:hypothetical protein